MAIRPLPTGVATLKEFITRPIRELSKNWDVDLAKLLDEYFRYLFSELDDSDNYRSTVNFSEAALVLQASSQIYSKKVDYLWECMLEVLDGLQMKKQHHVKDRGKSERRRADDIEKSHLFGEVLPKLVVPDIRHGLEKHVKLLVDRFHLLLKLHERQLHKDTGFVDDEGDSIHIAEMGTFCRFSKKGALESRRLDEMLCQMNTLFPPSFWVDAFQMIEARLRKLLHLGPEDPIDYAAVDAECERLNGMAVNEEQQPVEECNREGGGEVESITMNNEEEPSSANADLPQEPDAENTSTILPPPPPPPEPPPDEIPSILNPIPEPECSTSQAVSASPLPSTVLEKDDQEVCAGGRQARRRDKIVTVLFPCVQIPDEKIYQDKIVRKRKSSELSPDQIASIESLEDRITVRPKILPEYLKTTTFAAQHHISNNNKNNTISTELTVCYLIDIRHKKRLIQELEKRRIFSQNLEALRKKYSEDLTEDFRGFEDFEPSDGEEDGFRGFPDMCPTVNDNSSEDFHGLPDENMPTVQQSEPNSQENDTEPVEPSGEHSDIPDNASTTSQEHQAWIELFDKLMKWDRFLAPKLERAHERGHFDIHEYETQILEAFPQSPAKTTLTFAEVVADKATEDVPRYFLAALQLANACNIEIAKSDPDPLAMNCMELTLLSSVRQHEALEDYQAPSEERQGIRDVFSEIQAHSSQQCSTNEKLSRKRKHNRSNQRERQDDDGENHSETEDEDWLVAKKTARKRKINKR